jgi:hypothetical protein
METPASSSSSTASRVPTKCFANFCVLFYSIAQVDFGHNSICEIMGSDFSLSRPAHHRAAFSVRLIA